MALERIVQTPWVEHEFEGSELEYLFRLTRDPRFFTTRHDGRVMYLDRIMAVLNKIFNNDRSQNEIKLALHRHKEKLLQYESTHPIYEARLPKDIALPQRTSTTWEQYNPNLKLTKREYAFQLTLDPENLLGSRYNIARINAQLNLHYKPSNPGALKQMLYQYSAERDAFCAQYSPQSF